MPKKPIFTKKQIYKKAFDLFKSNGIEGISARNLAKALNSSPAPIYSFYSSIDELKNDLLEDAKNLFLEYIRQTPTDLIFLNIGMGFCIFAREEKELFQTIFLRKSSKKRNEIIRKFRNIIREEMSKDVRFEKVDDQFKMNLYLDAWTYAHGLATLIATNYFEDISDEEIKNRLLNSSGVIIYQRLAEYDKVENNNK